MTAVATLAGAPNCVEVDWNAIDWQAVTQNVRRLQARIVKAVKEGRWGKAKALQRLLTHSFSGKALAVRRVTENRGKRTPGVDGEIWDTPRKKGQAIGRLSQRGYRAQPLRRLYIPKKDGKRKRPLGIPTMLDRGMQALYKLALEPIAETTGDPNSYGVRRERSAAAAIAQCFLCLRQKTSPRVVYEGDIRGCFDHISHEWLMEHIPMEKRILRQWLKAGYIDRNVYNDTWEGTPQGGIISPVLANMTLDGLEAAIGSQPQRGTKRQAKLHLVRYADDYIATGSGKEILTEETEPKVVAYLAERGLEVAPEKTRITDIEEGFDFLGQNVRKYKGKLLIKPSKKSIEALLKKVRGIIRAHPTASAGHLILALNPVIRGWVNYHRHVVSKKVFEKIDHEVVMMLWRWAKRRHRSKSGGWVKAKYFGQDWVFRGQVKGKGGVERTVTLFRAGKEPIQRHVKVKGAANPYDLEWEQYFEKRRQVKISQRLSGKWKTLQLWHSQQGKCPVCQEPLTEETDWDCHHVVPRVLGGTETKGNLVLLHPTCHRQVHSRGDLFYHRVLPGGV